MAAQVVAHEATPELSAAAAEIVAESPKPQLKARRLFDAIMRWRRDGKIAADRDNTPKARAPKTAAELYRLVADPEASGNRDAGCYELSVLFVAMARSVGLQAFGVERKAHVDTGQIGHIMAAVRDAGSVTVYDLQNEVAGSRLPYRELDDATLQAHHYNHLAVAAFLAGNFPAARAAIDTALQLAPEGPAFLSNRATVLLAQGEPYVAAADAARAVELMPEVPIYRYGLGRALLESGDLDNALQQLQAALRLRPSYDLARRDVGWVQLMRGDKRLARQTLSRVAKVLPPVPDAALYLGLAALADGDKHAAMLAAEAGLVHTQGDESLLALGSLARGDDPPPKALAAKVARLQRLLATLKPN